MDSFISQLEKIAQKAQLERENNLGKFNIFNVLCRNNNEKYLHSRFISNLLSPTSRHGMGYTFFNLFIDVLSKEYPNLKEFKIKNCSVRPNEDEKSEYENIDILIENESKTQAIIIENKIFARDSNDLTKGPEDGIQLVRYFKKMKDEGKKEIFVLYLTLDRHDPERVEEILCYFPIMKIDYRKEIKNWIEKCIDNVEDMFLRETLYQYKLTILSLSNDVDRANELKNIISTNINSAWDKREYIFEMVDFVHVKWHTAEYFWRELTEKLVTELNVKILKGISVDDITKLTHKNKKNSIGIVFQLFNGEDRYIVTDVKEGLTYGKIGLERKKMGEDWTIISEKVKFSEFNNKDTFELINEDNCNVFIDRVIQHIRQVF